MKFGGSSVADAERLRAVEGIVRAALSRRPVVVLSALGGVTDLLERAIAAARRGDPEALESVLADLERRHRWVLSGGIEDAGRRHRLRLDVDRLFEDLRQRLRSMRILAEVTPRAADAVLAFGETLSTRIAVEVFRERGLPASWVDSTDVLCTDEHFGGAEADLERTRERCERRIAPLLAAGEVPVIGGFVGSAPSGATTTLGRGGSDTSAAVLGLALEAEEIQIWTDVDGLMSADPRRVPQARTLPRVSFAEAAELALHGARVLHPASIAPAVRRRIPVRVLNSLRPGAATTLILDEETPPGSPCVVALASRAPVVAVRVTRRSMRIDRTFAARVLRACLDLGVEPGLVAAGEVAVTLVTTPGAELGELGRRLGDDVELAILEDRALICAVETGLAADGELRASLVASIAAWCPDLLLLGASPRSVACVLRGEVLDRALEAIHRRFVEGGAVA